MRELHCSSTGPCAMDPPHKNLIGRGITSEIDEFVKPYQTLKNSDKPKRSRAKRNPLKGAGLKKIKLTSKKTSKQGTSKRSPKISKQNKKKSPTAGNIAILKQILKKLNKK